MRAIHGLVISVLAPILVGCSAHPLIDDVTRSTTFDIVDKIRCEAKQAVIERAPKLLDNTTVLYEFSFHIDEENNASGGLTWTLPLTGGGFTLTASGGSDLARQAIRNFTITDTFGNLRKTSCSRALEKNWIYPIAGDIGIYEVVATFIKLYGAEDPENPTDKETFSFHDTLEFTTFLGAGVNPTLNLKAVTDRSIVSQANASLAAQRADVHTVTIVLTSVPPTVSRRSPAGGAATAAARSGLPGRRGIRSAATMLTRAGGGPSPIVTNNHALSTTLLQTGSNLENAIYEADRARILALQDRVRSQVVGP